MSKPKKPSQSPGSRWNAGEVILLTGLTLTSLAVAVNVSDSTLFKPVFYYIASAALTAWLGWKVLGGTQGTIGWTTGHLLLLLYTACSAVSIFNATNVSLALEGLGFLCAGGIIFFGAYTFIPETAKAEDTVR